MRKPRGYDETRTYSDSYRLPAGGYVVRIIDAEEKEYPDGNEYLEIKFDIAEGEYRGFYQKQYDNQTFEPKKYKGTIKINAPKEDGTDQDNWTLKNFKTQIAALQDSDPNFDAWTPKEELNTDGMIGLEAGLLFRNKEYDYKGNRGFWTEPFRFIAVKRIRDGNFTTPKDKLLNDNSTTNNYSGFVPVDDEPPF